MDETDMNSRRDGFPRIRVSGGPFERGEEYGRQAEARIHRNLEIYAGMFEHFAGWDWERVRSEALEFRPYIEDFEPRYVEELEGLASGAGVELADVLAINVRTEIMFSARVPAARILECTAVAALPDATGGHTLLAQNWDWCPLAAETVVVLEARQDDSPDYVTVVEAGLLAKAGFNASGLGVVTNAMVTSRDRGDAGVPYHVILRAILDCERLSDAVAAIERGPRSSSANYLIAHRDGVTLNVEATPGDYGDMFVLEPDAGMLAHTNHFLSPRFRGNDVMTWLAPHSPVRLQRIRSALGRGAPSIAVDDLQEAFADHANHPLGVCAHPDTRSPLYEQGATVASLIMDLDDRRLWLAEGTPCVAPYRETAYDEFFAAVVSPETPRAEAR
jgi:isopenicillin-N N-acyltransferase-like protein